MNVPSRSYLIRLPLALLVIACGASRAGAQAGADPSRWISPELEGSVALALNYLARQQQPDGSFQNRLPGDPKKPAQFTGNKVSLTGLSVMAYLSAGRAPDVGKHGLVVRNGIEYLLKAAPADGYYGRVDGSRMTGHAIATIALAQGYGFEADEKQRKRCRGALEKAIRVIVAAQRVEKAMPLAGGWNHEPTDAESDMEPTVWCAMALYAARDAGLSIPANAADRCGGFILRCWNEKEKGFSRRPGGEVSPWATAMAVLALSLRGEPREAKAGLEWLHKHPIADDADRAAVARFAAAAGVFNTGWDYWGEVWKSIQDDLIRLQRKDEKGGFWPAGKKAPEEGQTATTALAVMTLSVPLRLTPGLGR